MLKKGGIWKICSGLSEGELGWEKLPSSISFFLSVLDLSSTRFVDTNRYIDCITGIMKRALAERAKQSGLPNGVVTASPLPKEPLALTKSADSSVAPASNLQPGNGNLIPRDPVAPTVDQRPDAPPLSQPQESQKLEQPKELAKVEIPKTGFNQNTTATSLSSDSALVTADTTSMRTPSSPAPRPKKRLRESSSNSSNTKLLEEEDQEDSNASAFFLRHQNRALASELRSVKYQLVRLERERDYRRAQCSQAVESLNSLQCIWTQLESSLCKGVSSADGFEVESPMVVSTDSTAPLSTGSGTSVEMIGALLNSLDRLRATRRKSRIKNGGDGDQVDGECSTKNESKLNGNTEIGYDIHRMDVDEDGITKGDVPDAPTNSAPGIKEEPIHDDSEEHDETAYDLAEFSDGISQRASALQHWIVSLLQKIQQSQSDPNGDDLDSAQPSYAQLQEEVTQLQARITTLQEHLEELARSRDQMVESDRRVRRGLYRMAAGRVQLKEVLKDVSSADGENEEAAAWMEMAISSALPSLTSSLSAGKLVLENAENDHHASESPPTMSIEEISQLKKQVADLNGVASSRDEQIKKVRCWLDMHHLMFGFFTVNGVETTSP